MTMQHGRGEGVVSTRHNTKDGPGVDLDDSRSLITERAAAKLLGVSPRVLWGLADAGTIPFIRIGPRLKRYDPRDLQDFIERSRHINRPVRDNAAEHEATGR